MNENAHDIFREMDTLADHLMARNLKSSIPGEYRFPVFIHDGDTCPSQVEIRETMPSCSVSDPIPEVHRIEDEVMVIAELPGATKESIDLTLAGNRLIIDADGGGLRYHTSTAIPPVDSGSMQTSIKNGVLEVKFRIAAGAS